MSDTISALNATIRERKENPKEGSYTSHLFSEGLIEISKKVGEEAVEVVVASHAQSDDRVIYESADLIYHLLVLLTERGLTWEQVEEELRNRFK